MADEASLQLQCQLIRANTGQNRCSVSPSVWKYYLLIPTGTYPTAAQLATFNTYMQSMLINDDPLLRWHLIGSLVGIEDNSEDQTLYNYQDGSSVVTRDEIYRWALEHRNGKCYQDNLIDFNGSEGQYQVIMIDKSNVMWGAAATDASSLPTIAGATMSRHYAGPFTVATYSDPSRFMVTIEISDVTQLNKYGRQAQLGFNVNTMKGVQSVVLDDLGSANWTTGVLNVSAATACGGLNFVTEFGALIADTDAWVVTNSVTGGTIAITTATALANGSGFALDLDQADANYPTSGQGVDINLVSVSALATLGVKYYEATSITIERP